VHHTTSNTQTKKEMILTRKKNAFAITMIEGILRNLLGSCWLRKYV
jgi:hypothetical protein